MTVAQGAWGQTYTAAGLGTLSGGSTSYPTAINASGQVVGYANTSSGAIHAFLYSSGVMSDLGSLSGDLYSQATGINNSGEVVGFASPSYGSAATYAFVYSGGNMTLLGTLTGDPYSVANAVNSSGQVAGYSLSSGSPSIPTAFLYSGSGSPQGLGTLGGADSLAEGINSLGQVVGWSHTSGTSGGQQHGFFYNGTSMTDLGTLSGGNQSIASAINTSGQIVGFGNTGSAPAHAFLYTAGTGMTDLGVISGYVTSFATAINSGGQIVGYSTSSGAIAHAFVYSDATMTDLNSVVSGLPGGAYLEYATAINDSGQIIAVASNNLAYLLTPNTTTTALQLIPVTPCRVIDTRNTAGTFGGPYIAGNTTRPIPVPSSSCGIPANAAAYSLNVTVLPRTGSLDYLLVWPTGQSEPGVSTLNSYEGAVLANAAIVPAGTGGSIDVYATDDTDLLIDINGYFVPHTTGSLQFYPLTPCRVLDTRSGSGPLAGPSLAAGVPRSFPIPSSGCDVPSGAGAYAFNVTVQPPPAGGLDYLAAWPTGGANPGASTLNDYAGTVVANAAIVPAGTGGAVTFYASNTTDLLVDINGYFAAPGAGGLNFYTVTPCRIVDTRNTPDGTFAGPIMTSSTTRPFPLSQGPCGIPESAAAYSLNVTVQPYEDDLDYLSIWPVGASVPGVSTLNSYTGTVVANAAIVPAGTGGAVNVFVTNTTYVIIDTNGYFQ
ncbi:MAG: hypothetical protein ABSH56_19045 [Bryobacteraceae bacterium]